MISFPVIAILQSIGGWIDWSEVIVTASDAKEQQSLLACKPGIFVGYNNACKRRLEEPTQTMLCVAFPGFSYDDTTTTTALNTQHPPP
jgi:hypothetical protein